MRSPIDKVQQEVLEGRGGRMEAEAEHPTMTRNLEEIGRLQSAEIDLSRQLLDLREQLAEFRTGIGDKVVDGLLSGEPGEIDDDAKLKAQAASIVAGIDVARGRRRQALEVRLGLLVEALRGGELQELQAEADAHREKSKAAMKRLEKIEGAKFIPAGVVAMSAGAVVDSWEGMIPTSELYRVRIGVLEREIDHVVGNKSQESGNLTARDRDALLQLVMDVDPMIIGPSVPDVLAWLDSNEPAQLERRDRIPSNVTYGDMRLFYHLIYSDGKVSLVESRIIVPALDQVEAAQFRIDVRAVEEPAGL